MHLTQGHLLQGRPCVPLDIDSFCSASVFTFARVFWVTALAQGSPLSPCSHSRVKTERPPFFLQSPFQVSLRCLTRSQEPRSCTCAASASLACSCHSEETLTCALPDLWVLQCQSAHVTKELNLLDSLAPQTGRTQRSFLILALYQLTVPATVTSALPTQTFESELTGHFQLFITKER